MLFQEIERNMRCTDFPLNLMCFPFAHVAASVHNGRNERHEYVTYLVPAQLTLVSEHFFFLQFESICAIIINGILLQTL